MAIVPPNLADLDQDAVAQLTAEFATLLQETWPESDLKRGVLHDLLLIPSAALATRDQVALQRYLNSRSLQQITLDPSLADEEVVDHIMSNFLLTRNEGSQATGEVTIIVSDNTTITIPAGLIFTANGQEFTSNAVYTAKAQEAQINSETDRLFRLLSDGNYSFTIEVTASAVGSDGLLLKDTLVLPETQPKNYITSYAASDFSDGAVAETNEKLLTRLQEGVAAKAPSNRVNMQAMLRSLPGFENVLATSIVGFADAEQTRDQHTIFPVSSGGVVDWYIRPQERLVHQALTVTALLQSVEDEVGTWVFTLPRDSLSGLYEIRTIRRPAAVNVLGSLPIYSDTRNLDLTGNGFIPDIITVAEGAFSRYQTVQIQFLDNETDYSTLTAGVSTASYDIEAVLMPLIAEAQDTLSDYHIRSHGADVLIRGAIPCFVQLSFTIDKQSTDADPDVEGIKNALAKEVNNVPFIGRLYSSNLHETIHSFLTGNANVSQIDMFARILAPDLTYHYLRSTELLSIPIGLHPQISEKTVQFFSEPVNIAISISTNVPLPS